MKWLDNGHEKLNEREFLFGDQRYQSYTKWSQQVSKEKPALDRQGTETAFQSHSWHFV